MINFDEMQNKAMAIIAAYETVQTGLEADEEKKAAIEAPIDENYTLIGVRGGETFIIQSADGTEQMDFIPDDEWEPGDIVGAYLSLYFQK